MSYSDTITYNSASSLSFNSSVVQVSGGALTLVGSPYSTSNPLVTSQHQNTISGLTSFSESSTLASGTAIGYQLVLGGVPFYYNSVTGSWAEADGTYATSNTAAVINSNASTLFSSLSLLTNEFLSLNIFLSTNNTSNAPILTSNTVGYTWTNSTATAINTCVVSAYLSNLVGALPGYNASQPVQLLVSSPYGFFHGSNFVEPFTQTFTFNSSGVLSATIIETTTPGVALKFSLTYWDGLSVRTTNLFNAIVPNVASINLANLTTSFPYDFG